LRQSQTIALLFEDSKVSIGEIVLDAALEEAHTLQARATEHPVEIGSEVADHVHALPATLNLEGVISNTPLSAFGLTMFRDDDRAHAAFKTFEAIILTGKLIDIVTTLKTYKNMIIEDFVVTRSADSVDALRFSCTAKQISMVSSKLINIAPKQQPKLPRARRKKSVGKQPAVNAPGPVAQKAQSLLSKLFSGT
jgi:hypothetical protein